MTKQGNVDSKQCEKNELLKVIDELNTQINDYEVQFENSSDGILIIEDFKFVRCNRTIVDMLGYQSKEQFLNLHPSDLSPEFQPDGQTSFEKAEKMMAIALKNKGHRFEWMHRKSNGDDIWIEVTLSPHAYSDRVAIHCIWKDISAIKAMQQQLVEKEKMSALGSLVAGVSHEINTPLGVALTGITHIEDEAKQILERLSANELGKQRLKNYLLQIEQISSSVYASLNNAAKMVQSFKQIAADQNTEKKRVFNLREYSEETFLSLKHNLEERNVKIINDIAPDIEINSFVGAYSQILTNLVMNSLIHAFEEICENPEIKLSATLSENKLAIMYEDNGKGIEAKHISRIFDPFFTTKLGQGSGLGLSIIYNLVNHKLEGSIDIKNKKAGIKITINVPV